MRAIAITIACLMFAAPLAAQEARVAGYETYAVVEPAANEAAARPLAEQHCKKYGRFAYFRHMDAPMRVVFDCVVETPRPLPSTSPFGGRGIY
jgi:hypothetical protein